MIGLQSDNAALQAQLKVAVVEGQAAAAKADETAHALRAREAELTQAHARTVAMVEDKHRAAMALMREQLSSADSQACLRQAAERERDIESLRAVHNEELAALEYARRQDVMRAQAEARAVQLRAHEAWAATAQQEMALALQQQATELAQAHEASLALLLARQAAEGEDARRELASLLAASESSLGDSRAKFTALEQQLTAANATAGLAISEVATLECQIQQLRAALETRGAEVLAVRRETAQALVTREADLAETHRKQLEEIIAGYRDQFARAREEASKSQGALKARLTETLDELERVRFVFRDRPSREEDVLRIDALELSTAELSARLKVLTAENHRLQLEVIHQDQSFHMVFKNSPSVGTLSPLAKSPRTSAGHRLDPLPSTAPRTPRKPSAGKS